MHLPFFSASPAPPPRPHPHLALVPSSALILPADARTPQLFLVSFDQHELHEQAFGADYEALLRAYHARPDLKHWLDVRGLGDRKMLTRLRDEFHLSVLHLQDILHDCQRPKFEVDAYGRFFLVSRMLEMQHVRCVDHDQLSIFTGPEYLLSFQSDYRDCLEPLRARLQCEHSLVRCQPALYVAYALLDSVMDSYFPLLRTISEHIDDLEDRVFVNPTDALLTEILDTRKEVVRIRRLVAAERDKLAEMLRLDTTQLSDAMRPFIRDLHDNVNQLIEASENAREAITNVAELHQSRVNTRMNQVMKVLTIVSSIFIPLSFLVGVYGMNFQTKDPQGHPLPWNLPELYHPYGYPILLGVMALLVAGQLLYFWRRGWFR